MQVNVLPCNESSIWIPSAFTPNDDLLNDSFDIKGYNILYYKLLIFNRWGEEVFVSEDLDLDWDGTYLTYPVQEDVYVYSVKWQGILGKWGSRIGSVTLIR
jgi:gliding motility-associated-like protein